MKIICDRGSLVELLNLVSSVVPPRTPKPVLTCVKLVATDNMLTMAATDLEVSVRASTNRVEVQTKGEALIPCDKFSAIVRESADPTLTIEADKEQTTIRGQDARYKILGYPTEDFPELPEFKGEVDFEITGPTLAQVIHQTIYATAKENSRYAINGVLMERDGNMLSVVATDGHRLAIARDECKGPKGEGRSAIVPTKSLTLLLRLLGSVDQNIKVKVSDNLILFATETGLLSSNLVEGNFPPYKDVVPRDGDRKATLTTDNLASAFRRGALLINEESKGVRLSFTKDALTLSSRAPETGEAEIKVDLPAYEGEPIDIGLNPYYMLDALKVVDTEQVVLDMRAPNKPGVLRSGSNFVYVVMPVSLL